MFNYVAVKSEYPYIYIIYITIIYYHIGIPPFFSPCHFRWFGLFNTLFLVVFRGIYLSGRSFHVIVVIVDFRNVPFTGVLR